MLSRIAIVAITAFWVTMNVLLWRQEVDTGDEEGSRVPPEAVVEKILTSPDNSSMEIRHQGERVGFARWSANIGEDMTSGRRWTSNRQNLEGMVRQLDHYSVDCDGSFSLPDTTNRFSFYFGMEFTTNQEWESFSMRVSRRPDSWSVRANRAEGNMTLDIRGEGLAITEVVTFEEVRNPSGLMTRLGIPFAGAMLEGITLPGTVTPLTQMSHDQVTLRAYNEVLEMHHARVRVHRLELNAMGQYQIKAIVSRVGELFLVELPFGIRLVNDQVDIE